MNPSRWMIRFAVPIGPNGATVVPLGTGEIAIVA